jgi:hypothetical protein
MIGGATEIIVITLLFHFATKHWHTIAYVSITLCLMGSIFVSFFVPESPEYLHGKRDFQDSRDALTQVAHFNFVYNIRDNEPYEDYKFI